MPASPALELTDVSLTYHDGDQTISALDHVSIQVAPGELVAVTGPSGSGKSTLLAVAGLLRAPDTGRVTIDGIDAADLPPSDRNALRRDHIAFVFQSASLFPSLTAVEQLELVAHIRGNRNAAARQRARDLLTGVGLGDRLDRRPSQMSGGERQRVGIARAMMSDPTVLLVDEPTASLDQARSDEIMELIAREAHERRTATLLVTHDLARLDLADRHLHMVDGAFVAPPAATPTAAAR